MNNQKKMDEKIKNFNRELKSILKEASGHSRTAIS